MRLFNNAFEIFLGRFMKSFLLVPSRNWTQVLIVIDSGHSQREEINELTRNQHLNCIRSMARNDDQKRKYEFLAYY